MGLATLAATTAVTNEETVGLPPLSATRRDVWASYRLEFLADGYPARRTERGLVADPVYGVYVITDYLGAFARTGERAYLDASRRVADAALSRMEPLGDALVFPHAEHAPGAPRYSAVTQARYLLVLGKLISACRDARFGESASAVLRSLRIPVERGGALRAAPAGGVVLEDKTGGVPQCVLQPWLRASLSVAEYAADTGDPDAADLVAGLCEGLRGVLPQYDVPELATTRARLSGSARVKLSFSDSGCRLRNASVLVPGYGSCAVADSDDPAGGRFVRGVERRGRVPQRVAIADVAMSRITWPSPNRFRARIDADEPTRVVVQVGQGDFDPYLKHLKVTQYSTLAMLTLEPGRNDVDVPVGWQDAEMVAYPTGATRTPDGGIHNPTHASHVDLLRRLAARTGDDMFLYYAVRWSKYPQRWPTLPLCARDDMAG